MKWIVPLLVALLPCWATAADTTTKELLSELPQCARSCLSDAISKSDCDSDNTKCICASGKVLSVASICVSEECSTGLLIRLIITLCVFSGISILLRIGCKVFIMNSDLGLDDLFTIVSFCCSVPSIAITIHGTARHGVGRDIWTLKFDDITTFGFFFYILEVLYLPTVSLLKMSLLFFYLRIFFLGLAQTLLWGTIIFNAIYGIIFTFIGIFQCTPISYSWTKWDGEHEGTYLNTNAIGWANASISIALDLWMLAIPLWFLRNLKLHWKKKIGIAAIITIVSIIRMKSLVNLGSSENPTYDQVDVSIWSTVEIHIGIICVSMPALRILLIRLYPILRGRSHALVELPSGGESLSRPEHGRTEVQRTFKVQYFDGDEAMLVASDRFPEGEGPNQEYALQLDSKTIP
ncbi:hypothetical protein GE09DRAFT_1209170 [Coniochaeta sp. 2T2.1]|nr:hypothetical protein GE09DRAFT_1209170 [Coniochaeta sp. 2T2.1]